MTPRPIPKQDLFPDRGIGVWGGDKIGTAMGRKYLQPQLGVRDLNTDPRRYKLIAATLDIFFITPPI